MAPLPVRRVERAGAERVSGGDVVADPDAIVVAHAAPGMRSADRRARFFVVLPTTEDDGRPARAVDEALCDVGEMDGGVDRLRAGPAALRDPRQRVLSPDGSGHRRDDG